MKRKSRDAEGCEIEPFPRHLRPTPDECLVMRDKLLSFHGFPSEFVDERRRRLQKDSNREEESVLDGLIKTVLSQNTNENNSNKAYHSLKSAFPTWNDVIAAEADDIENAIRCGGLAPSKTACIKNILDYLVRRKGGLNMEYLRDMSPVEVKAELSQLKGVGPKTIACVLMFNLGHDDLPVDTHVFEIAKAVGWVPFEANRKKTYDHLNRRVPDELKFDLNCLLYAHGKMCRKCIRSGSTKQQNGQTSCPLVEFSKHV